MRDWGQVRQRELMFASVSREQCSDWAGEGILKFGVEIFKLSFSWPVFLFSNV